MPSFNEVPSANYTYGFPTEVDKSGVPGVAAPREVLIVGYDDVGSPGVQDTPTVVGGSGSPFGKRGQITKMIERYRSIDANSQITAIALDEPAGGTAADGDLTITGTATEDGTLAVYAGGEIFFVAVETGDTATDVAAAIVAEVEASPTCMITASNTLGVVTFTARFKGEAGNGLTFAVDPKDSQNGVAGVVASPSVRTALTGGAGQADLAAALALVSEADYYSLVSGLADATNHVIFKAEIVRRLGATVHLLGRGFLGVRGTFGVMQSFGISVNAAEIAIMGSGTSLSPPWEWASVAAAIDTVKPDPATGYSEISMGTLDAPALEDRPNKGERDSLLSSGVSTFKVSGSSVVMDRLVTSRSRDASSDVDLSQLAMTQERTIDYLRRDWRSRVSRKFKNFKLASEPDIQPKAGQKIITPGTLQREAIAWFEEKRDNEGLVQGIDKFKADLAASVNGADPNRLDLFSPPTLVRELVTVATVFQPR